MGIQTIVTPTGEEMVVMSKAEYEALITAAEEAFEDGADVEAYDAALRETGPEDILPAEVTAEILRGVGRLRAYRNWRQLDIAELASASGLAPEEIVDLETGKRILSREQGAQLAPALHVPLSWLAA